MYTSHHYSEVWGITINYNKAKEDMSLSMPGYATNALTRFNKLDGKGANFPTVPTVQLQL